MEQSDSDKLQPPSLDGVFARKRREKQEREATPRWTEPYAAPTPVPLQPEPKPAPTPVPTPDPIPDPAIEAEQAPLESATVEEPEAPPSEPIRLEPIAAEPAIETMSDHRLDVSETAVLARVTEEAEVTDKRKKPIRQKAPKAPRPEKVAKTKAPRAAKTPRAPKAPAAEKVAHTRRFPAAIATIIAGACSGGVLTGLVAAFNRWGGQTDSINAVELLGAFVAAIVAGFVLLAIARVSHRAAIAFLGVGLVAVVLMFFPSDSWQTVNGSIVVVVATAVAYLGAHMVAREATSEN